MINTAVELTLPLAKSARKYASSRGEGCVHPATFHRWRVHGLGGIRLECIKVGGVWHTSQEALQRFFEQLTAIQTRSGPPDAPVRSPTPKTRSGARSRRDERVEAQLDSVLCGKTPSPSS